MGYFSREMLAKDLSDSHSLQWKSEREGSVDRVTAMACVVAEGAREAQLQALGSALWGYKLLWTAPRGGIPDEFLKLRRERAERDKHEAYLILACLLNRPHLKAFRGPRFGGKLPVFKTGWYWLAVAGIEEWVNDLCRQCHGAKNIKDPISEAVVMTCPVCHGSGKHRFTDDERRGWHQKWVEGFPQDDLPNTNLNHWNSAMGEVHNLIGTADRAMMQSMGRRLER